MCAERVEGGSSTLRRILPLPAEEAAPAGSLESLARDCLLKVGNELQGAGTSHLASGAWGSWRSLVLRLADPKADLAALAEVALAEEQGADGAACLTVDWAEAVAVGGAAAAAEPPGSPAAGPEADAAPISDEIEERALPYYLARVLRRLLRMKKVGAAHTDVNHFFRGVPARLKGDMKRLLGRLVKDGYIRLKPTVGELHLSLEPAGLPDVTRFVEEGVLMGKLASALP
ncbi:MAG: hypothetical protein HY319_10050 [Armatimonadetes bacterium]|nr:hypothetical protein [Armatimonadota bacterium]